MEDIYSWIKSIVIYMIINTIVMNLLGNKSYKKYVSIVSGMILVLIVISPLMQLMKLEDKLDYYLQANDFSMDTSEYKNDLEHAEDEQKEAIFSEYKERIRLQVKKLLLEEMVYLESFDVTLDMDPDSATYAQILRMDITADTDDSAADNNNEEGITIKEIEAIKIIIGEEAESQTDQVPSPIEINIKNKLSDFYNIEQGNINITVQGR